jgi:DNA-binding HxlR family transcriptional regulator
MPYRPYDQTCSIASTLALVGERWTLLILRDVLLGARRFEDLQRSTGAATNILSDRLETLVEHGILRRVPLHDRPDRFEYRPTRAGAELAHVLQALMQWGDRHAAGTEGPPRVLFHTACGHETEPVHVCAHCGEPLEPDEVEVHPGPGATAEMVAQGVLPRAAGSGSG